MAIWSIGCEPSVPNSDLSTPLLGNSTTYEVDGSLVDEHVTSTDHCFVKTSPSFQPQESEGRRPTMPATRVRTVCNTKPLFSVQLQCEVFMQQFDFLCIWQTPYFFLASPVLPGSRIDRGHHSSRSLGGCHGCHV